MGYGTSDWKGHKRTQINLFKVKIANERFIKICNADEQKHTDFFDV